MKNIKKSLLLSLTILFYLNVFSQNYSHQQLKKSSQTFTEINPALIEGTVTDIYTGEGLEGVDVYAGSYSAVSDNLGYYILTVEPGVYDIHYSKLGYENVLIEDTTAVAGETLIIDVDMTLILYQPSWVSAWPNDEDTECIVNWIMPYPYTIELYYDDGTADDYFIWATAGNANAVRFTPAGYPFKVIGGRIYVGDGSFPNGGNIIGSTFGAVIYDDDGVNGLPGTMLDSIGVTVNNYEWVEFSGLDADIYEGDFYLAMFQGEAPPDACPIGIDYTVPTVCRSYSYLANNNEWTLSAYQDFMIRALISPDVKNKDLLVNHKIKTSIEPDSYVVARFSNFDPNGSVFEGDTTIIADSVLGGEYIDQGWAPLPMGWFAYGIKTRYILSNGQTLYSDYASSNIVGHLMGVNFTICVTLSDSSNPAHTEIQLTSIDYPYNNYYEVLDSNNNCVYLENVWKGFYDLYVYKPGYESVNIIYLYIYDDAMIDIHLYENIYPPRNLYVNPLTSIATWDAPQITAILEDFNGDVFPPVGWTMESEGAGWFKTDSFSFPSFQVPLHNSQFACVIDYQDTVNNNGCCDYLVTPSLDLRESEGFSLKFDSYYTGANGQSAYIEYSLDIGATWELLYTLLPSSQWEYLEFDLSAISSFQGPDAVWLAFHADDNGQQASGWAIDNVEVSVNNNSDWPPLGYHIFLDGDTVVFTEETSYQFQNLTFGVEYEASVAALYTSGLSERIYYTFESRYLYPPRNLQGMSSIGTDYVYLIWETPLEPFDYVIISEKPSTYQPDKNLEYSPIVRMIEGKGYSKDQWDVQFNFTVGGVGSEVGLESDGNYIYTSQRDAGNGTFFKYGLDSTFLGSFVIPGCQNLCDLAYDGAHFFGSNATTSVWEMDFQTQTVVSTIIAPLDCRAIAYDESIDGFWCNNWSTDIVLFDKNGVQINSFPVGAYANFHGFAYDGWSPGGPFLWGFSRDGSGAEIVQMDIFSGAQIFNFNVLPLVGGSGVAGGLFSHCELVEPGFATLSGILQSELIFGLELTVCSGGGIIPENLLGFNIYRNGEYQDYIESIPDSFSYEWYDFGMEHDIYEYVVTAVYDLTPYGFPGDTAESMEEGPVIINFFIPIILPFYEDWNSGYFELNNWTTECVNWQINLQTGNPLPSAEFQGDTALINYNCGLISGTLLGQEIIDGEVWFDFDIMLDSWVDTAIEEKMIVKVWENDTWHTVAEFINQGDMDWTLNHFDISEFAKGNYFKLGFFATGLNSADILSWYIDNIHVYRVCLPPYNMSVEMEEFVTVAYVYIDWTAPYPYYGEWLSYNDGTFENAVTDGGAGLAQVFTPPQYPCTVTEVRFFVSHYLNYYQDEEVYVLTGDGATILAGPYVVSGVENDWVTVDVDDVTITEGTFMVATFNVLPNGPFIGIDDSYYDATLYFGTIGNFTELGEYGYLYIGSHEAYVEYETSDNVVVNSVLTRPQPSNKIKNFIISNTFSYGTKKPNRDLLGFNIFRSWDLAGGEFELIGYTTDTIFTDTIYTGGLYFYYATVVYDQCESDSSNNACIPCYVGIEKLDSESTISVYPNPAKDFINIISTENINKITVINFAGQKVYEKKVADETNIMLNTASYETGVYIIKIETENVIIAKRVAITR